MVKKKIGMILDQPCGNFGGKYFSKKSMPCGEKQLWI